MRGKGKRLSPGGCQEESCQSGGPEDSVVELHCRRVLRDIAQRWREGENIFGNPSVGELGEAVVDQARVESSNKGAGDECDEGESFRPNDKFAESCHTRGHLQIGGVKLGGFETFVYLRPCY